MMPAERIRCGGVGAREYGRHPRPHAPTRPHVISAIIAVALALAGCAGAAPPLAQSPAASPLALEAVATSVPATITPDFDATPLPTREPFGVGTTLPYVTQTGDTLTTVAVHFNTTAEEVLALNPTLPLTRTLAPGLALKIPAYWFALGGSAYEIIPDSEFVYGPTSVGFDIEAYVAGQPGYLRGLSSFVAGRQRTGAGVVQYLAESYSINPRLLLALMEWRTGALTQPSVPDVISSNPFGALPGARGLYGQLRYVAEQLSQGYYGWRTGQLTTLKLIDSTTSRPDMYQSAGGVAVQYLFAQLFGYDDFIAATGPEGFGATYIRLWGNPSDLSPAAREVIPGDLTQPELTLPFAPGEVWAFTGGPHPVWGDSLPWAALDFAPSGVKGCRSTERWATAAAPGVVVRSGENTVVLDLDGDGYEQTGWVLFYFHLSDDGLAPAGARVQAGDRLGHPSCQGGTATGTHIHVGRKFNGEWIPADGFLPGVVPFELGGWVPARGDVPYLGRMMRLGTWVEACTCSTAINTVYWVR